mgnify:CR=1 FL=1
MKITFTRNHTHYGARYRAGDQIELAQDAAERLVRDGVARVDANELMRHLRGKRRTLDSVVAHDLKVRRN